MDTKKLTHLWYWLTKARGSGFVREAEPEFNTGIFGWGEYTPKQTRLVNKTLSVKDQTPHNNCTDQSTTVAKEPDEGVILSASSLSIYKRVKGLLSGNGWSSTTNAQKGVQDFGIAEEKDCPSTSSNWEVYANPRLLTAALIEKASKHKSKTYWSVNSRADRLKLLDEGRILVAAAEWYTGFNQGGGFKFPWLIKSRMGLPVGGHQFAIKGYDMNYHGVAVYICQNSYGALWGDKGDFYVSMDYLDKNAYSWAVNLDIERPIADIVTEFFAQNVKGDIKSDIFYIYGGVKHPYLDPDTFAAFNGHIDGFTVVPQEAIDKVPLGDPMKKEMGQNWPLIQEIKKPFVWRDLFRNKR